MEKNKLPDFITEAIKAGEQQANSFKQAEEILTQKKKEEERKYAEEKLIEARIWVLEELPELIRDLTTQTKRELSLGSSDYDNPDFEILGKVEACKEIGLKIKDSSYNADPGEEGAYSHGAGCNYYVTW